MLDKTRFNIGDTVWVASYDRIARQVACPDCGGTKTVTVVLYDKTDIVVDCQGCYPGGIEPPTGYVALYEWQPSAIARVITKVEEELIYGKPKYGYYFEGSYCDTDGDRTFATQEEAVACAEVTKKEREDEENNRRLARTKQYKFYAWNAHYHRKCAKQAQHDMEMHLEKARIFSVKGKEDAN